MLLCMTDALQGHPLNGKTHEKFDVNLDVTPRFRFLITHGALAFMLM